MTRFHASPTRPRPPRRARWLLLPLLLTGLMAPLLHAQENERPPEELVPGTVQFTQKISDAAGGFTGALGDFDLFGSSVASLGDLDGDGTTEIAVGAIFDDDGGPDRGAVWVLFLNANGTVKNHQKISDTEGGFTGTLDNGDRFGNSVASLGDLDGDGITDLAVGAHFDDDGGSARGAVWVLFLNANGTVKNHQKISDTEGGFTGTLDSSDEFGTSVAPVGDLDNDGVTDLAVSAPEDDDGGENRGAVWVLFLNTTGTVKSHQKISSTEGGFTGTLDDGRTFGTSVASLGDLDGDGIADLAIGAQLDDDGGSARGAVWLLFLNANGTVKNHQKISDTEGGFTGTLDNGDRFGSSVASLGDLDGDGTTDIAVGAIFDDDGGGNRGAVWVLFLDALGRVQDHQKISDTAGGFSGTLDNNDVFGSSVTSLGDLDGDGITDIAVGATGDDDGGFSRGATYVLFLDGAPPPAFFVTLKKATLNQNGQGVAKIKWNDGDVATGKIDVYVDGAFFQRTANDGKHKIRFGNPAAGPFVVRACFKNSTAFCSNALTVDFTGAPFEFEHPDDYDDDGAVAVYGRLGQPGEAAAAGLSAVPEVFALRGNYPNPFNPSTVIRFDLPEAAQVSVAVYDVLGREVLALPARPMEAGVERSVAVEAAGLPSGAYVYRVVAQAATGVHVATGRMVLMK